MALGLSAPAYAEGTSTTASGLSAVLDQPFSITADRLEASPSRQNYVASGNVQVRRPGAVLYADSVRFDEAAGLAHAEGHVVAVDGSSVMTCDRVTMRIPELFGGIEGAELRIKAKGSVPNLEAVPAHQARRAGRDELIVTADHLERPSGGQVRVKGASFTACDCGAGNRPSWRIWSKSASIDLSSGAWLTLPVFYVLDVPVMALPLLYVPLGQRRTGLLTPRFGYVSNTGFRFGLPVFFALSRSWDMTVEPFYLSERGAGMDLELRYSPSRTTRGVWRPSVVADLGQFEDGDWKKSSELFLRWAVAGEHDTRWAQGRLRADINLMGDPAYQSDFANAFLSRQAEYTRSRVTYSQRWQQDLRAAVGLQLMQDLRPDTYAGSAPGGLRDVQLFSDQVVGDFGAQGLVGAGSVRYRFMDLVLDAPSRPLFDGLQLLAQARLAVSAFAAPRPEVARFVRADLRPEVALPIDLPLGLVLEPSVAGRFTAWAGRGDSNNVSATRLAVLGHTRLFTDLSRDFGSVVHRIVPTLEHLIIPGFIGVQDTPGALATHDEIDALQAVHQVRARLHTELLNSQTGATYFGLQTWMGRNLAWQDSAAQTSEWVSQADLHLGRDGWPVLVDLLGRTAVRLQDTVVTEARASVRIADRLGDSLALTWARFDTVRPDYMLVGLEELVPSKTIRPEQYLPFDEWRTLATVPPDGPVRQDFRPWRAYSGLTVSARAHPFKPLTLAFDMTLDFDNDKVLRNTRSAVGWKSPCDCWSAYLSVSTARDREGVQVDFGLDLARLGSVSN